MTGKFRNTPYLLNRQTLIRSRKLTQLNYIPKNPKGIITNVFSFYNFSRDSSTMRGTEAKLISRETVFTLEGNWS